MAIKVAKTLQCCRTERRKQQSPSANHQGRPFMSDNSRHNNTNINNELTVIDEHLRNQLEARYKNKLGGKKSDTI
jgi:hypothetical protein